MEQTKPCPLCKTECTVSIYDQIHTVKCCVCGEYTLIQDAELYLPKRNNRYIISGVTRNYFEQYSGTKRYVIREEMIDDDVKFQAEFVSKMPKSVLEKATLLLQYLARNSNEKPSTPVLIMPETDYPIAFCKDKDELKFYIDYLTKRELIISKCNYPQTAHLVEPTYNISLTVDGWVEVEKLKRPNLESKQAFVAMRFNESMNEIFEKGISPLGNEKDKSYTGFKMLRIDQKHFNDKICDHIIAEIKQSRFMIADCTELRHAVFFEAGYAMGLGLPVIFTCQEGTEIKECFDTDHYNHIIWKDADDLRTKLKDRILATIGKAH
jgi:nucleoside 2-deoxyribosyltransferase